ncbi:endonuclease/exonuclease/phosphatase family protein [Litoreibacter janthinus]|uniref:Endonuclease/Exonuclease/phosphatase family protein n=1 Tax=Litoreibacter janthinus TaxID=670154 RepID=A0A1I6G7Y2_9RHOB|nr:endonuclease/exonuclease/phosphatase family protein [Litoreibacter janthinus]SFR38302.1 Endonuclease/Exonuclease/phosphatase family protein [Litoreibacter janthinus]
MTDFTIASFNVKNLIGPDQEYYRFEKYTPEEHAWKEDWLADQVFTLNADIVGFQEIFDKAPLQDVIAEADRRGTASNEDTVPDRSKRYARKAIFRKLAYRDYSEAHLAFAPNINDGEPGERRPGLAILSRFGFVGKPEVIQEVDPDLVIPFAMMGDGDGGSFRLDRLSRPILKARIPVGSQIVTVFNCHLKSKLGEFTRPKEGGQSPEVDLVNYDPVGRALGSLRAATRRMAEAWVLRQLIVEEINSGIPVIVLGDFNDSENAVSSEIIAGERPFKNYAWMRRHDAKSASDRYTDAENEIIQNKIKAVRLESCEKLFVRKSLRDMVYTSAFGGVFESIDQILLSRHFTGGSDQIGEMSYFSVFNDHLTDGSHDEAPYNKLASDHGQIMAHLRLWDA